MDAQPSSYLTELALRTAVNSAQVGSSSNGGNQTSSIKSTAESRARDLVVGSSSASGIKAQLSAQSTAIAVAVQCLELAFVAINGQLKVLKNQRLAFEKERLAGIAAFILPTNKEAGDLSTEDRVIKSFVDLAFKHDSLKTYFGIRPPASTDNIKDANYYVTLPYYLLSDALGQPIASQRPLDKQRTAISLFFKSALPEAMSGIETGFQTDNKFIEFWKSAFEKDNYLNDLRAPRFIMMSLANLLWNLQHPVDPETGFPLSLDCCVEKCREVERIINQLLNSESEASIHVISTAKNQLVSFVRKIEIHTKALRAAYAEEQLQSLNIGDVTTSADRVLRIMDKSVLKLIYKRRNPITHKNEPVETAAETLAYTVSYLNQLLIRNPELGKSLQRFTAGIPAASCINTPAITVMDVLIVFCHLPSRERRALLAPLLKSKMDSELEFAMTLEQFDVKFIQPVEKVSEQDLVKRFRKRKEDIADLTARRLIPFITLVVEDYRVSVDTERSYQLSKQSQANKTKTRKFSGKEQVDAINKVAEKGNGYYQWILSPFIELAVDTEKELDKLPKHQYRMTQIRSLLDSVSEIVLEYRSFLQLESFQAFLLKCLNKVKEEYLALARHIKEIDSYLASDEVMSRSMQEILFPMTDDLTSSLNAFALAATNFERVVSAPDFPDQQRRLLSSKLDSIHQQFSTLFAEDSGLTSLIDASPLVPSNKTNQQALPTTISKITLKADPQSVLKRLVTHCYNNLSSQSKKGHKGALLGDLINNINGQSTMNEAQVKQVVMELVRVVASYRETCFFQASYGQTRSARALIAAIKNPAYNETLPLAAILFDKPDMSLTLLSDNQILRGITRLHNDNAWQESVSDIQMVATI